MALSDRFERAFGRLVGAFRRHDDTKRADAELPTLAASRQELDEARDDVRSTEEGRRWRTPREPDRWVERGRRSGASRLDKIAVVVATVVFLGGSWLVIRAASTWNDGPEIQKYKARDISTSMVKGTDDSCTLHIEFSLGAESYFVNRLFNVRVKNIVGAGALASWTSPSRFVSHIDATPVEIVQPLLFCSGDDSGTLVINYTVNGLSRVLNVDF